MNPATTDPAPLVFITGASSGIGQALALQYARQGYRLALVARRCQPILDWLNAAGIESERFRVYAADVRQVEDMVAVGRACITELGLPDVVIANAGISAGMDTAELADLETLRISLETNVLGMAATFHPFLAGMFKRRTGTLVGIASVAGIRGLPGHGAYCASKAAAINYCESLRGECRSFGLQVVTLAPGYVDTPLTSGNRYAMPFRLSSEEFARRAVRAIARGRSYAVIPWQMAILAKWLRVLPNAVFDRALARRPRKQRRTN